MVIWLTLEDGPTPIQLLQEYYSRNLQTQLRLWEAARYLAVSAVVRYAKESLRDKLKA